MFQVDAGRGVAAALAALLLCACPGALLAQEQPSPPIRSTCRRSIRRRRSTRCPTSASTGPTWRQGADEAIAEAPDAGIADAAAERRYTVRFEGLDPDTEASLAAQFDPLSTLDQNRREPANAAQIDRRAREDADLLAELLRARGYYDALVRTRVEARGGRRRGDGHARGRARPALPLRRGQPARASRRRRGCGGASRRVRSEGERTGRRRPGRPPARRRCGSSSASAAMPSPKWARWTSRSTMRPGPPPSPCRSTRTGPGSSAGSVVEGRPLFSARHIQTIARWKPGAPYRGAAGRGSAAGADRHRPGLLGRDPAGGRRGQERRPRRLAGAGADAHRRRPGGLRHRRRHQDRGELAAPQPASAGRRGHLPRRGRNPGAADRSRPQAQQFPSPRPGADRAVRGQPYRPRRLRRPDHHPRRARSSGRPTSSGRRNGPGRPAPSWSPPTSTTSTSPAA